MAPGELERRRRRMWLVRAKRIDDVVLCWMKCMQEFMEKEAIARDNPSFQVDVSMHKRCVDRGLRNVADVIFSEATNEERARMPTRSRPELVLEWALQEVKSPITIQRARWGCVVGIMPPRIPPPPPDSTPPLAVALPST
ncbi:hypothetical protein VPH35_135191 [Triticum aestivum]